MEHNALLMHQFPSPPRPQQNRSLISRCRHTQDLEYISPIFQEKEHYLSRNILGACPGMWNPDCREAVTIWRAVTCKVLHTDPTTDKCI